MTPLTFFSPNARSSLETKEQHFPKLRNSPRDVGQGAGVNVYLGLHARLFPKEEDGCSELLTSHCPWAGAGLAQNLEKTNPHPFWDS